ncbi:DUF6292 family protein [Actinophytocola algeriensis]|uniref:DUF6292 family protein n=1 Tax=Actinophytocola algeriensis TaxID=1768010 RepID=UPI0021A9BC42|nr:DUF6292 family protein [Actinophytocola algeriensis]
MLCGLRRYVRLVAQSLGLHGECSYIQADESACAYIALDARLSRFPDRDVALLWDEEPGWSAALETHSGEDLLAVAYLEHEVLPHHRQWRHGSRTSSALAMLPLTSSPAAGHPSSTTPKTCCPAWRPTPSGTAGQAEQPRRARSPKPRPSACLPPATR